MKQLKSLRTLSLIIAVGLPAFLLSCNNDEKKEKDEGTSENKMMSKEDMIKRGDYIVTTASCGDCHSPKKMTQMGPVVDSSALLSGHPANEPMPPVNLKSLEPGQWMSLSPDITAFTTPFGIVYTANLTPDSATGIGSWSESQFISTIRNGKHLGNGRDLLPPMPWQFISKMTDDDLKAVFAYLRSLPPVSNRVPAPVSPDDVRKMPALK
jgi:mono/diheme cytochrome c family protein